MGSQNNFLVHDFKLPTLSPTKWRPARHERDGRDSDMYGLNRKKEQPEEETPSNYGPNHGSNGKTILLENLVKNSGDVENIKAQVSTIDSREDMFVYGEKGGKVRKTTWKRRARGSNDTQNMELEDSQMMKSTGEQDILENLEGAKKQKLYRPIGHLSP
ncbi:hypothetical protein ACOSP7_027071 [Xanthoceras sorbifolium]